MWTKSSKICALESKSVSCGPPWFHLLSPEALRITKWKIFSLIFFFSDAEPGLKKTMKTSSHHLLPTSSWNMFDPFKTHVWCTRTQQHKGLMSVVSSLICLHHAGLCAAQHGKDSLERRRANVRQSSPSMYMWGSDGVLKNALNKSQVEQRLSVVQPFRVDQSKCLWTGQSFSAQRYSHNVTAVRDLPRKSLKSGFQPSVEFEIILH